MSKFIILSTQRTGSTLLQNYLDQHPNVTCFGEMFINRSGYDNGFLAFKSSSIKTIVMNYVNRYDLKKQYLDNLLYMSDNSKTIGFKLMYDQISPELLTWIDQNNIKIIHIIRRNILKVALSRKIAKITKKYHSYYEGMENYDPPKVYLNPDTLLIDIQNFLENIDFYRNRFSFNPSLEIYYEDFVQDKDSVSLKIFNFLEIPFINDIQFSIEKINPDSVKSLIGNYEEIYNVLNGTPFQNFLN